MLAEGEHTGMEVLLSAVAGDAAHVQAGVVQSDNGDLKERVSGLGTSNGWVELIMKPNIELRMALALKMATTL